MTVAKLYPWLRPTWQQITSALEADRLPSSLLFYSDTELGGDQLLRLLTDSLLCNNYVSESCGFCHSCELVKSENHPDLHWISPEKEGKTIAVEQIRQCNRLAQESSQLGGKRIFVISPADAMNESASNALLKTLEEPSENCIFILQTQARDKLLPTIVSRCQQWHLAAPEPSLTLSWLAESKGTKATESYIKLNRFSPLCTSMFYEQKYHQDYEKLEHAFIQWMTGATLDFSGLVKLIDKDTTSTLNWLWFLLTDAQKLQFELVSEVLLPGASKLSILPYNGLYKISQTLLSLMDQLKTFSGLNQELMITQWLIESREELCS